MTETTQATSAAVDKAAARAELDVRRRKLLFRSWHRGMKEMDIIFGQYADEYLAGFTDAQLDEYERLLEVLDRDLFKWVTGESVIPAEFNTPLFQDIIDFRKRIAF